MAIDKKFLGKKYSPVIYEVGKEKVKEYAMAITDNSPYYLDDKKGIVAPPTFAVVYAKEILAHFLLDKNLSLNLTMLVHGEQEFEFFKLVKPGDIIATGGEITDIRSKAGLDFITCETTSTNQNNEMVSKGKWTFIIRGG